MLRDGAAVGSAGAFARLHNFGRLKISICRSELIDEEEEILARIQNKLADPKKDALPPTLS